MEIKRALSGLAILGALAIASAAAATENDDPALTELVQILRNQGVLDEGQYNQLTAKAARQEAKESWTDRISLWGDFRGRYEGFYYIDDDDDVPDRSRLRYRLRLNAKAKINDRAEVLFRLTSGSDDNRSTNQTLGSSADWDSDPIVIDRAYVRVSPFAAGRLPDESGSAWIEFGKVPNPFVWKVGKDFMLWDHDINFEGASILYENDITENVNVFLNSGYYVVQERSSHQDPNLMGVQAGTHIRLSDAVTLGGRATWYRFGDVTSAMVTRGVDGTGGVTPAGGNIPDGITGGAGGGSMNVIEGAAYLQARFIEDWPITLYADMSGNLDAQSSSLFPEADSDGDLAWGVGAEIGDKKKVALIGVGYWRIEANAFFSQFIDSDLFDGETNRKGFVFYTARQILPNTEVSLTAFWSEPIANELPAYAESVAQADRVRVQADMIFKF